MPKSTPDKASPRTAREEDAAAIAALLTELGHPTTPLEAQRRLRQALADRNAHVLVVDGQHGVVAVLSAQVAPYFPDGTQLLRVTALVVAASHRGKGTGKMLLERCIDIAESRGCAGVELTTAEHRAGAQRFYERLGFRRTSLRYFRPVSGVRAALGVDDLFQVP
jgi:ribosomal protein S18 acetylase RimI-like enzyme